MQMSPLTFITTNYSKYLIDSKPTTKSPVANSIMLNEYYCWQAQENANSICWQLNGYTCPWHRHRQRQRLQSAAALCGRHTQSLNVIRECKRLCLRRLPGGWETFALASVNIITSRRKGSNNCYSAGEKYPSAKLHIWHDLWQVQT